MSTLPMNKAGTKFKIVSQFTKQNSGRKSDKVCGMSRKSWGLERSEESQYNRVGNFQALATNLVRVGIFYSFQSMALLNYYSLPKKKSFVSGNYNDSINPDEFNLIKAIM